MAMSKGKKSKSYSGGYGGGKSTSKPASPSVMGGGQIQGKGGRGKAQRGMTMTRTGGAKGSDMKCS